MKKRFIAPISVFTLLIALNSSVYSAVDYNDQIQLFEQVFEKVKKDYVEEKSNKELTEAALNGMLTSLDPHSSYLDEKSFNEMKMQTKGEFGGLGLEVTVSNGLIKVISPIDDTPAFHAGVKPGDLIVAIDDQMVMGMTLTEAVDKMRGQPGTSVHLTIIREGSAEPLDLKVMRKLIKVTSVKSLDYVDIGYIRINSFSEDTTNSVIKEIAALKARHGKALRGLILDLRNNPGGLLDQAINVSDIFLDSGEIVSTKGRHPESNTSFKATKQSSDIIDLPIVVLINGGSASASEIVAGALQDHKRAVIMGTKSFGKGSVQNVIPLPNKGAMRLTTARYYTPSGRSIQAEGIKPDIVVEPAKIEFFDKKANSAIYSESALKGHLTNGEAKKVGAATNAIDKVKEKLNAKTGTNPIAKDNEKELYEKDYQLARGLDLLRGMLVFKNEQKPIK